MHCDLVDLELINQVKPWDLLLKGSMNFSSFKLYSVIRNSVYLSFVKRKLFIKTSTQNGTWILKCGLISTEF